MATFLLNVVFLVIQVVILGKRTDMKMVLQLPASFVLGYFISFNMNLFGMFNPSSLLLKTIYFFDSKLNFICVRYLLH